MEIAVEPGKVELVPFSEPESMITSLDDIERIATACAQSGFYKDVKDASQAVVKMLAGQEMGVGPIRALAEIHIVEGKPAASAGLIAANVKRSGRYDYRLLDRSDERCEIQFFEHGKAVGTSAFSMEDAQKAKLADRNNWKRYPRAMLFARALTEGVRVYCPDAAHGVMYTPEELKPGLEVNEHGTPQEPPPTPRSVVGLVPGGEEARGRARGEDRAPRTPAEEALGPQHKVFTAAAPLSKEAIEQIETACRSRLRVLALDEEKWTEVATQIVRDLGYQSASDTPMSTLPLISRAISTWNPSKAAAGVFEVGEDVDQRPTIDDGQRKLLFAKATELFPGRNAYDVIHEVMKPLGFVHVNEIRMESLDEVIQALQVLAQVVRIVPLAQGDDGDGTPEPGAFD